MDNFKNFMKAQILEIEKYKWIESEKAGHDLGQIACIEWIKKYAVMFRLEWLEHH